MLPRRESPENPSSTLKGGRLMVPPGWAGEETRRSQHCVSTLINVSQASEEQRQDRGSDQLSVPAPGGQSCPGAMVRKLPGVSSLYLLPPLGFWTEPSTLYQGKQGTEQKGAAAGFTVLTKPFRPSVRGQRSSGLLWLPQGPSEVEPPNEAELGGSKNHTRQL